MLTFTKLQSTDCLTAAVFLKKKRRVREEDEDVARESLFSQSQRGGLQIERAEREDQLLKIPSTDFFLYESHTTHSCPSHPEQQKTFLWLLQCATNPTYSHNRRTTHRGALEGLYTLLSSSPPCGTHYH